MKPVLWWKYEFNKWELIYLGVHIDCVIKWTKKSRYKNACSGYFTEVALESYEEQFIWGLRFNFFAVWLQVTHLQQFLCLKSTFGFCIFSPRFLGNNENLMLGRDERAGISLAILKDQLFIIKSYVFINFKMTTTGIHISWNCSLNCF